MKQQLFDYPPYIHRKKLAKKVALCIAAALFTLLLNILCAVFRTDSNHALMLTLNIVTDVICGGILVFYIGQYLLPEYRLYQLLLRFKSTVSGTVEAVSEQTVRYMDITCYQVTIGPRRLFVPAGKLAISPGQNYTLKTISNVIVEVEQ